MLFRSLTASETANSVKRRRTTMWCNIWCMTKRMSLTLELADEAAVAAFSEKGTPEHQALLEWATEHGLNPAVVRSDAALMRVLLRAGAETLRERALDEGYAELAAVRSRDAAAATENRQLRGRYARRTDSTYSE